MTIGIEGKTFFRLTLIINYCTILKKVIFKINPKNKFFISTNINFQKISVHSKSQIRNLTLGYSKCKRLNFTSKRSSPTTFNIIFFPPSEDKNHGCGSGSEMDPEFNSLCRRRFCCGIVLILRRTGVSAT